MTKLHPFSRKTKEKDYKSNSLGSPFCSCVCVCSFSLGNRTSGVHGSKRQTNKEVSRVEQSREANRADAPDCGRYVVCMLYSFINYTDFKAALFYNARFL